MFDRKLYYSQTELVKKYNGLYTAKQIKKLILYHKLPVVENKVTMYYPGGTGSYQLTTRYVLIADWLKVTEQTAI